MKELFVFLICVIFFGGFGGFLFGISSRGKIKIYRNLELPWKEEPIDLGFVGDVLIGTGASISILFITRSFFNIEISVDDYNNIIQVLSISIIAGFAGTKVLTAFSSSLEDRINQLGQELTETKDRNQELIRKTEKLSEDVDLTIFTSEAELRLDRVDQMMGNDEIDKNELDEKIGQAKKLYQQALSYKSNYAAALIGLAKVLRRQGDYKEAIAQLDKVIKQPEMSYVSKARAYYNRSCYKYLLIRENLNVYRIDDVIDDLRIAVDLAEFLKDVAEIDPDFDEEIRRNKEFQRIVGKVSVE